MKKHTITTHLNVYDDRTAVPLPIQQLIQKAEEAAIQAYAPYSNFKVGAAVRTISGEIFTGNNQENAAYPSGLCAERVVLFHLFAMQPQAVITDLVVTAIAPDKPLLDPVPPCGSCRQVIAECESRQGSPMNIWFTGETGKVAQVASIKDLLPLIFDASYL